MKTLILVLVLFLNFSFPSYAKQISLSDILQSFDLCSMKSSFGQLCKIDNPNKTFYDFMIDNKSVLYGANFNIEDNFVTVESDNWFYKIDIISSENKKAVIEFIDDSKIGSYYAHSRLDLKYDEESLKWIVIKEETLSLSEDAKKVFSYLQVDDSFMQRYVEHMMNYLQTGVYNKLSKKNLWKNNSNNDHIKFAEWMADFCMQAYYIQLENVKSAKLSLKNKKVTYSENYFIEVEKSNRILEAMPLDPNSYIYQDFMQGFIDQMAHTDKNTKSFLLSAATGQPMTHIQTGIEFIVDETVINQTESNLYLLKILAKDVISPIK